MKTLPLMMAMIATSYTVSLASASQIADFNNDGNVDASDLVLLVGNLNVSCEESCPTDLNEDGVTNITDLMELMAQWGPVPDWEPEEELEEDETNPSPTRDENRDMSWQGQAPVLLDAIYYDQLTEHLHRGGYDRWHPAIEYNQGEYTKAWTAENNVAVLQSKRWNEILGKMILEGDEKNLSEEFILKVFKAIHQESINHQEKILKN